jgi:ferredoxin
LTDDQVVVPMLKVWIDQDLCTGDGLCTDHCPELFVLLEDGISYVVGPDGEPCNDPGGSESMAPVPERLVHQVVVAAEDCPGECIFIEDAVVDQTATCGT